MTMIDDSRPLPSTFPTRRSYAWLAAAAMAFAVHVSIIPFDFVAVPLESALAEYQEILREPRPERIPRTNYLANILLFVPIGFGLSGALLLDRARRPATLPAAMLVLPTSVSLSLFVEFLQIFVPGRVPGRTDIEAQTIGCVTGILLWALSGRGLTRWLRAAAAPGRGDRLAHVLAAYGVGWIFVNLAPFDITLDPGELARRVRTGLITIVPFGGTDRAMARLLWDVFAAFASAVPLGALGLVGWTGSRTRRDARGAFAFGAALVLAVEAAQIFIRSHAADTADVLFGCLGVAAGVWAGRRTVVRHRRETDGAVAFSGAAAIALVVWCLVLAAYQWMPYDFTVDSAAISRKLSRMSLIPFSGYHRGSDLNALNDVLVKLGLSAPLGFIASYVVPRRGPLPKPFLYAWLALAAGIFGVLEFGQFFLPARVPNPTDVVVGVAASTAGLWLGRWLQRDNQNPPEDARGRLPTVD